MQARFIMTAFGEDRPGIVADVTGILYDHGCNLEETAMTMLAEEFTLNLLFSSGDPQVGDALQRACRRLEQEKGITAFVKSLRERRMPDRSDFSDLTLHVEGLDQAGIVYRISRFLADHGINVVDLKSQVRESPESGTNLYLMDIHLQVPPETVMEKIEDGLRSVSDELHVDISLIRTSVAS
jgi:glycine cleavage system transcriptional repressor